MNSITRTARACHQVTLAQQMHLPYQRKCFSVHTNESDVHIGKQLSRPSERVLSNRKNWSTIVSNFPKTKWSQVKPIGLNEWSAAAYEHQGLQKIHKRSFDARVLLEIRDVRVPASSHHPSFTRLARHRTHLIAYTHADLIDAKTRDRVETWTSRIWPDSKIAFIDTRVYSENNFLPHFDEMLDGLLYQIECSSQNFALTVGCANVGKSSVLMSLLRRGKQRGLIPKSSVKTRVSKSKSNTRKGINPPVEDVPGKTREITEYLLREKPRAFFMDVPGITPPPYFFEERPEAWFGLGAANLLPLQEKSVKNVELQKQFCNYVLHCANRDGVFNYVDKLHLDAPTNDIDEVLSKLANSVRYGGRHWTEERLTLKRCENFLKLYNTGNLGSLVLDNMSDFRWRPFHDKHSNAEPQERPKRYTKIEPGNASNEKIWDSKTKPKRGSGQKRNEQSNSGDQQDDDWFNDYDDILREIKTKRQK